MKMMLILLLTTSLLSGCASIHQTFIANEVESKNGTSINKSKVYAGVKKDAGYIPACFTNGAWAVIICPITLFAVIDLPFSFVADTLFLPYTIPNSVRTNQLNKDTLQEAEKERALVIDFVKNNNEVIRITGGIKELRGAHNESENIKKEIMPNRYEVTVVKNDGKLVYVIVGVSRSQGNATFNYECTTHLMKSYRDLGKDVCAL